MSTDLIQYDLEEELNKINKKNNITNDYIYGSAEEYGEKKIKIIHIIHFQQ